MNRIHRTVWNQRRGAYMVAAETTRSSGKASGASGALLAGVLMGVAGAAQAAGPAATALPTGGQVTAGQAQIGTAGSTLTVTQRSDKAAINWGSFSIGKDATVQFVQPNAGSVALNRVVGTEGSVIDGSLKANGQVFVLNPNGVLFGKDARVDTAGLVATTLKLSDADFLAGKTSFAGHGGSVVNQGSLNAKDGGYIALIGHQVKNDGTITAKLGTVALAAGNKVSLNFNGNSLVGVVVDEGALDALVANGGAVRADGGLVLLTAKGAEGLVDTLVNNTGEVRAQTVENKAGRIYLLGEGGKVEVAGTLDASAPAGDGGFIETSGSTLVVKDGATVRTNASNGQSGTWLIDPTNFTISAGTGTQTTSGIGASTLQTALGAGNVTIQTQSAGTDAGNINVNAPVSWAANLLTLEAHGDINVNAVMTASGTSTLNLKTGYNFNTGAPTFDATKTVNMAMDANGVFTGRVDIDRTGTGILTINNAGYTLINSVGAAGDELSGSTAQTLQGMARQANLTGNYALASNVDASSTASWSSGAGFRPIGTRLYGTFGGPAPFTGAFDGLGHSISGLTEARNSGSTEAGAGLFGVVDSAALRNVGLVSAQISGYALVGVLVGEADNATHIANVFSSGVVSTDPLQKSVGGLVGSASAQNRGDGTMRNVRSSATVTGGSRGGAGGLVGASSDFDISDASFAGNVTSTGDDVGGLVGDFEVGTLTRVAATGTVTGINSVGGLVGYAFNVSLVQGSFNGTVSGAGIATAGLIAYADGIVNVSASQASGTVTGSFDTAGLVGIGASGGNLSITDSTSSSTVIGVGSDYAAYYIGGAVGEADLLTMTGTHATGSVSGDRYVGGLVGYSANGSITASSASGPVTALGIDVGGLVGQASETSITSSSAIGDVTGSGNYIGGLVGYFSGSTITDSYATGVVTGTGTNLSVGGLVGYALDTTFVGTYAIGNVSSGGDSVGGLIGTRLRGDIQVSYASGNVSGGNKVGGLVGSNVSTNHETHDVYARGSVSGSNDVGGLIGYSANDTLTNSYSTGQVTGTSNVGGLIGERLNGSATSATNFWDVQTSGLGTAGSTNNSAGGTGRTTADLNTTATFTTAGWDFAFSTGVWGRKDSVNDKYPVFRRFGYTDPLTLTLADAGKVYGDANPTLGGYTVTGCPTANCVTGVALGSAIGLTTGVGTYAYSAADVLNLTFAGGLTASQFEFVVANGFTITPRPVSLATLSGATRVYDRTTDAAGSLFALGNLVNGDTVALSGTATLASANAGVQALTGTGTLTLGNPNYTLVGVTPSGTVTVTPRAVGVATVGGATRVYDATTDAAAGLLQTTGVLAGDTVNLSGTATLASKNAGAQAVGLGTLALDNANYTLVGVVPSGTVAILPRTLNLSFTVADKTFDGSTAASATASDDRISGDQFTTQFSAAFGNTNAGSAKSVAITGLALTGADAGNYQFAAGTGSGVTGNMLARIVTYALAAQDPAKTYTANGTVLVSASALDQLVVASFANTVAGTSPGALSYTIYKNGQQVSAITDAGTYEIRASFAAADPHYALASTGNSALTIGVAAAAAGTPPVSGTTPPSTGATPPATGTTPPSTGATPPATGTTPSSPVTAASAETGDVIGQAVRTEVPVSTAAVLANAGVGAPRSLVDFSAMPPNVATSPAALTAAFGEGVPLSLLSSPSGEEPSEGVTLEQAKRMVATPAGGAESPTHDVRVPVSRNSLAQIVNGGVKLPGGVDQLLFVVKADK